MRLNKTIAEAVREACARACEAETHEGARGCIGWSMAQDCAAACRAIPIPAHEGPMDEAAERDSFCAYLAAQRPPVKPRWNEVKTRWEYRDGRPYPYCETAWRFWMARAVLDKVSAK